MKLVSWATRFALSFFFVLTGSAALVLARGIPVTGFQNEFDPGPRAVPTMVGVLLLVGGVFQGVQEVRREIAGSSSEMGLVSFWVTLAALTAYALVMPYLGFGIATFILISIMTYRLGSRWWVSVLFAIGLVLAVQLLFVNLFKVAMPQSAIGLPF